MNQQDLLTGMDTAADDLLNGKCPRQVAIDLKRMINELTKGE